LQRSTFDSHRHGIHVTVMASMRPIALLALIAVAGCSNQADLGPARSTGPPFGVNDRELETPNSLPPGSSTDDPFAPETGVIGVTRAPP
jgi:hypothetical protein